MLLLYMLRFNPGNIIWFKRRRREWDLLPTPDATGTIAMSATAGKVVSFKQLLVSHSNGASTPVMAVNLLDN